MNRIKKRFVFVIFMLLVILQLFFFYMFLQSHLTSGVKVFAAFINNLFSTDNFIVSKLDLNFFDKKLNQNLSGILNEGPNSYIEGIYYSNMSLKYVKKVKDGYLLYEIPERVIKMPQAEEEEFLILFKNEVVYSNNYELIGSKLETKGLFSKSEVTDYGFEVVIRYDLKKVLKYSVYFLLPLLFLYMLLLYVIKFYSEKDEKVCNSINNIVSELKNSYEKLKKRETVQCHCLDTDVPELENLQNTLKLIFDEFSGIIKEYKVTSSSFKKTIKELEETHKLVNERDLQLITALAEAVELKDTVTGNHSKKVVDLSVEIANLLGISDPEEIEAIKYGAILHDIGKIGIPESILNKPSKLTAEEFEIMKKHTIYGEKIIKSIPGWDLVAEIIRHHHENWDGSGYPDGLKGDEISLRAQIISIADVFTALTEDRPYRKALSEEEALEIIRNMVGQKFSEKIYTVFLEALRRFKKRG
ncbi:HD-GYP domain-containing protein [Thermosipho atlanticus]|uniref:HDIG domain-containing protein n=1 Tax=Thermosipho atlanticus DSM 15807 TaxID=1123380 RepID=A0A1M5RB45_9BACT|nr:HD-GYP domain-containing protein [Thermosipho atlanticus]SHH23033.1 HDIG domain-containing protein [Thermosipho atlanticus DSM 15807]